MGPPDYTCYWREGDMTRAPRPRLLLGKHDDSLYDRPEGAKPKSFPLSADIVEKLD